MNDEPDLNELSTVWGPHDTGGPGQIVPVAPTLPTFLLAALTLMLRVYRTTHGKLHRVLC